MRRKARPGQRSANPRVRRHHRPARQTVARRTAERPGSARRLLEARQAGRRNPRQRAAPPAGERPPAEADEAGSHPKPTRAVRPLRLKGRRRSRAPSRQGPIGKIGTGATRPRRPGKERPARGTRPRTTTATRASRMRSGNLLRIVPLRIVRTPERAPAFWTSMPSTKTTPMTMSAPWKSGRKPQPPSRRCSAPPPHHHHRRRRAVPRRERKRLLVRRAGRRKTPVCLPLQRSPFLQNLIADLGRRGRTPGGANPRRTFTGANLSPSRCRMCPAHPSGSRGRPLAGRRYGSVRDRRIGVRAERAPGTPGCPGCRQDHPAWCIS